MAGSEQKMSHSQGSFERMRVTMVFASPGAGKTTEVKRRFLEAVGTQVQRQTKFWFLRLVVKRPTRLEINWH